MTCVGVSVWYIVRPSGLNARPLLIVIPERMRVSEKSVSRRYSAAVEASRALVHGAGEQAALRIAAAVVEAMVRGIVRRGRHLAHQRAVLVREPEAAAKRHDEAAGAAQREAADRFRHRHHRVLPGRRIETVERRRIDVDPVQDLVGGGPDRAFAETRLDVEHAAKRSAGKRGDGHGRARDKDLHRTRKSRSGSKNPRAGAGFAARRAVERVGHVRHRLHGDEVMRYRSVHYDESGSAIGGDADVERPARDR